MSNPISSNELAACCATPGCEAPAVFDGLCMRCDAANPFVDGPDPETCKYCGKELEDFSDLGCEYCDRRVDGYYYGDEERAL